MTQVSVRNLTISTALVGSGRLLGQVLNVLVLPLALLYISAEDFGLFSLLQIVALMGGVLMSGGLYNAFIARFSDPAEDTTNLLGRILTQQILIGCVLLTLLIFLSTPIQSWLGITQRAFLLAFLLFGEFFANMTLTSSRWQMLVGQHLQLSMVAFSRSAFQLVLVIVLVMVLQLGLTGLVIADMGSKILAFAVVYFSTRHAWKLEFKKHDLQIIIRYGLAALPDPIFFWLLLFLPLYELESHGLLAIAGAFSLGWRLMSPIELLGNSLATAAAGRMVEKDSSHDGLIRWHRLSIFAIVYLSLGILFFSADIIQLFFDSAYLRSVQLLPFLGAGVMFLAYYYFEWVSVSKSGKTYGLSLASGAGVFVMLLGTGLAATDTGGIFVAGLFALGFAVMWSVARFINVDQRYGNWLYQTGVTLLTLLIGIFVVTISPGLAATVGKLLILGGIGALLFGKELLQYLRNRITNNELSGSCLSLPNYAEVAKKLTRSGSLLDIGCSEGFFLGDLDMAGAKVGVDTDFERLREGKQKRPSLDFVCAHADYLPFRDASFETATLIGVLPYVEKPVFTLKEVNRVLVASGHVEISAANSAWLYRLMNVYGWKHKFHYYSLGELDAALRAAGFHVKSLYSRGLIITPFLANFFVLPSIIDRWLGGQSTVLGPFSHWARRVTNPIVQWEYDHVHGAGYQNFASGERDE